MRIAITEFESTVSPLFDVARRLLIADVAHGAATTIHEQTMGKTDCASRLATLGNLGVQVVVCGAISGFMHHSLVNRGIRVYPWVSGDVHDVLDLVATRYKLLMDGKGTNADILAVSVEAPDIHATVERCFRHCRYFLIVRADDSVVQVIETPDSRSKGCEALTLVRRFLAAGVNVLLTGRCGPNALGVLRAAGVDVILGVEGTARNAVRRFRQGGLVPSTIQGLNSNSSRPNHRLLTLGSDNSTRRRRAMGRDQG